MWISFPWGTEPFPYESQCHFYYARRKGCKNGIFLWNTLNKCTQYLHSYFQYRYMRKSFVHKEIKYIFRLRLRLQLQRTAGSFSLEALASSAPSLSSCSPHLSDMLGSWSNGSRACYSFSRVPTSTCRPPGTSSRMNIFSSWIAMSRGM